MFYLLIAYQLFEGLIRIFRVHVHIRILRVHVCAYTHVRTHVRTHVHRGVYTRTYRREPCPI